MDQQTQPKKETNIILKFFLIFFAVIGFISSTLFFLLIVMIASIDGPQPVPRQVILEINLESGFVEYLPSEPVSRALYGRPMTLFEVVATLEKAADDQKVKGLVAKVGGGMGMGQIQELRAAVKKFRDSGKPAIAYSETFGEFSSGNGAYYLATAFDEVYLQPSGDLGLIGLRSESMFLKGALDKLGVEPRGEKREEYKNAFNQYTEKKYTPQHLEATQSLLQSQLSQIIQGITETRGISANEVTSLIDRGPFLGQEAVDADLVDGLAYRDQVYEIINRRILGDPEEFSFISYFNRSEKQYSRGSRTIALIYGDGTILRGQSAFNPVLGDQTLGSSTVAKAFRDAVKDDVNAIIFRVNSPGGSYNASDIIRREIENAQRKGIPVIVSMGDVAASGGYFVALDADKIIAQPGTITGSIGVYALKMLTEDLFNKLGISFDSYSTNKNANAFSTIDDFSPEQWEKFQQGLDRIYDDFTGKVAEGRSLSMENVLEVAKGRVWTGEEAITNGLVDELGGFPEAISAAKEAANIFASIDVKIAVYPEEQSAFDMIMNSGVIEASENKRNNGLVSRLGESKVLKVLAEIFGSDGNIKNNVLKMRGVGEIK